MWDSSVQRVWMVEMALPLAISFLALGLRRFRVDIGGLND